MFRPDWIGATVVVVVLGCGGSEDALLVGDGSEQPTAPGDSNDGEDPAPEDPPPEGTDPSVEPDPDATRPQRLSEHTASYLETAEGMLVFGGTDGVPSNCGLPSSNLREEAWFFHEDDTAEGGSWELLDGATPGPRLRHMAASSADKAWIFGGRFRANPTGGAFTLYDDLWEFDAETMEFSEVQVVGVSPPARASGSLCFDAERQQLWLFGGNTSPDAVTYTALGDLWRFDLAARTWEEVETQSVAQPEARLFHSGVCDAERDQLVVFAGGDQRIFSAMSFGDLWALDLATLEWRALDDASSVKPVPRFWQTLEWDRVRNSYVLFGGHDDTDLGNRNDLGVRP